MKSYKILCIIAILAIGLFLSAPATAYQLYSEDFESGTAPGFTLNSFWHATGNAPYAGSFALGFVHDETPGSLPNGSYAGTGGSEQFAFWPKITLPN